MEGVGGGCVDGRYRFCFGKGRLGSVQCANTTRRDVREGWRPIRARRTCGEDQRERVEAADADDGRAGWNGARTLIEAARQRLGAGQ